MDKTTELPWKAERSRRFAWLGWADIFSVGTKYLIAEHIDVNTANHIVMVHNWWLEKRKGGGEVADTSGVGSGPDGGKAA